MLLLSTQLQQCKQDFKNIYTNREESQAVALGCLKELEILEKGKANEFLPPEALNKFELIVKFHPALQRYLEDFRDELTTHNVSLTKQVTYLTQQAELEQQVRQNKLFAKQKRSSACKLPLRDVITLRDFFFIISLCNNNSYKNNRKRLAFCLLYMTGLRVSNLLVLTVKNVQSLFADGSMQIPLIKRGDKRHNIVLSKSGVLFMQTFKPELKTLAKNKGVLDFLFTSKFNRKRPLSRENLAKELNLSLKQASHVLGKHLRTHSLRATMITDLLQSTPLHKVKDVIGHADIKSTHTYSRGKLSKQEITQVMETLGNQRALLVPQTSNSDSEAVYG